MKKRFIYEIHDCDIKQCEPPHSLNISTFSLCGAAREAATEAGQPTQPPLSQGILHVRCLNTGVYGTYCTHRQQTLLQ